MVELWTELPATLKWTLSSRRGDNPSIEGGPYHGATREGIVGGNCFAGLCNVQLARIGGRLAVFKRGLLRQHRQRPHELAPSGSANRPGHCLAGRIGR